MMTWVAMPSPSEDRREYLLAELRCAALRADLIRNDIVAIGLALKGGLISPDDAVQLMAGNGLLQLLGPARDDMQ
jgi:hypothetical protein